MVTVAAGGAGLDRGGEGAGPFDPPPGPAGSGGDQQRDADAFGPDRGQELFGQVQVPADVAGMGGQVADRYPPPPAGGRLRTVRLGSVGDRRGPVGDVGWVISRGVHLYGVLSLGWGWG